MIYILHVIFTAFTSLRTNVKVVLIKTAMGSLEAQNAVISVAKMPVKPKTSPLCRDLWNDETEQGRPLIIVIIIMIYIYIYRYILSSNMIVFSGQKLRSNN